MNTNNGRWNERKSEGAAKFPVCVFARVHLSKYRLEIIVANSNS